LPGAANKLTDGLLKPRCALGLTADGAVDDGSPSPDANDFPGSGDACIEKLPGEYRDIYVGKEQKDFIEL